MFFLLCIIFNTSVLFFFFFFFFNDTATTEIYTLSLHDALPIRKGKPQHPTQFGYTLLVAEDERGFVADHQLQQGNPPDGPQLVPSVERVANRTGRVAATVFGGSGCNARAP